MKKIHILESADDLVGNTKMKVVKASSSAPEKEETKTYVVNLRFNTGFTPIIEDGEVKGSSTSIHFKHKGDVEEAKEAYTNKLAELGLNPDIMDFTEEVNEIFSTQKTDAKTPISQE
jgi:hypothetical protein